MRHQGRFCCTSYELPLKKMSQGTLQKGVEKWQNWNNYITS